MRAPLRMRLLAPLAVARLAIAFIIGLWRMS